jgi:hypothetical protein
MYNFIEYCFICSILTCKVSNPKGSYDIYKILHKIQSNKLKISMPIDRNYKMKIIYIK